MGRPGTSTAGDDMSAGGLPPVHIPHSARYTMHAEDGTAYSVLVAWPLEPPPPTGHPVVCLVDPERSFGMLVDSVRMRGRRPDATSVVPAVVVGIGPVVDGDDARARRTLDFTGQPSRYNRTDGDAAVEHPAGGAAAFHRFIRSTVIPAVLRDRAGDESRVALVGHSLGGLFVIESLLLDPGAFSSYVSISPSVWWDPERLLTGAARIAAQAPDVGVHIAVGEYDQAVAPWQRQRSAAEIEALASRRQHRAMVDDARRLAERLGGSPQGRPRVHFHLITGEDHVSVVPVALGRVLRSVLKP